MTLKILRWSILILSLLCLLISIANSQKVKKTVSVKTPERISNVHEHFTPKSHNFNAQHTVDIDRTQKLPSILKQFFVLAPLIVGSQNEHFDPALPEYEAIGEVLLNPKSSLIKHPIFDTHQNPESDGLPPHLFLINTRKNENPFLNNNFAILPEDFLNSNGIEEGDPLVESPSQRVDYKTFYSPYKISRTKTTVPGVHLRKSISVKSPERISNVISHFSPVQHVYSAISNLIIDREIPIQKIKIERLSFSTPISNIFTDEQEFDLKPILSEAVVTPPETNKRLKRNVGKHVEVHLLEHRTSHIDHFNPRGHHYDAIENIDFIPAKKSLTPILTVPKPEKKLEKHVEVHLKEHRTSHIDHFNPRGHHYDAVEDLFINQGKKDRKPVKPKRPSVTVRKTYVKPHKVPAVRFENKRPEKKFKVQKHVEVHLPENRISHIDHFNPRQHHYDAEEDVSINQGGNIKNTLFVKPYKPVVTGRRPVVRQPKSLPVVRVDTKGPESGLLVDKNIKVHLTEHRVSHIDHFNPAQHHYDARENVVIRQGQRPVAPTFKQPKIPAVKPHSENTDVKFDGFHFGILTPEVSTIDGYNLPTFPIKVKDSGTDTDNFSTFNFDSTSSDNKYDDINSYLPPSTEKPTVVTKKPIVFTKKPTPPVPTIPPKKKRKHIHKHVEVHVEQHRISPHDHFNPVSHHYDAVTNLDIK